MPKTKLNKFIIKFILLEVKKLLKRIAFLNAIFGFMRYLI
jgi:hypothetical protein